MSEAARIVPQAGIQAATLKILGGPGVVVRSKTTKVATPVEFKYAAVEHLGRFLDVSAPRVMRIIIANERTAQRRKEQGTLTAEESDRLARIARVTRRAVEAFGDEQQATEWLRRSNRVLGGEAPIDLLGSDAGAEQVTDELGRIEYGELY